MLENIKWISGADSNLYDERANKVWIALATDSTDLNGGVFIYASHREAESIECATTELQGFLLKNYNTESEQISVTTEEVYKDNLLTWATQRDQDVLKSLIEELIKINAVVRTARVVSNCTLGFLRRAYLGIANQVSTSVTTVMLQRLCSSLTIYPKEIMFPSFKDSKQREFFDESIPGMSNAGGLAELKLNDIKNVLESLRGYNTEEALEISWPGFPVDGDVVIRIVGSHLSFTLKQCRGEAPKRLAVIHTRCDMGSIYIFAHDDNYVNVFIKGVNSMEETLITKDEVREFLKTALDAIS